LHIALTSSGPLKGHRVAVTGLGALTGAGVGIEALWDLLLTNGPAASPRIEPFDATHLGNPKTLRHLDPFTIFALVAADEAWRQSGLVGPFTNGATIIATGFGGLTTIIEQLHILDSRGPSRVSPYLIPKMMPNAAAAAVSMRFGLGGPCENVTTACAAGTHAIGTAARLIASGRSDVALAGGSEAYTPLAEAGFRNMTALADNDLSRPFDSSRSGFVMSEGAAVLVLEEWGHARARGATILAEVLGAGSTADAHHITVPDPSGAPAARCMNLALLDADLTPSDVSHINAHGTSTPLNDDSEAAVLRAVFASHVPPVTSNKGHLGHALGAAGAIEAVVSVLTLLHQVIPPTAGTTLVDPALGLDIVLREPRATPVEVILSNSFGFGGHNASVIFGRAH
jgi:3-oxoacyl-[acyl-carrier-protein] synthase II